jgi:hypothetical protein
MAEIDSTPKSIQSLYGWFDEGKLWVNRRYQRKLVWTLEEKQKLVSSVLSGYPIPAILLAERQDGGYEVIDGLQRLHTFMSFIETAFPTLSGEAFDVEKFPTAFTRSEEGIFEIEGDYEGKLSAREVSDYLDYSIAISIMRGATDSDVDEVFSRINTYGHQLSEQERRQAGVKNNFSDLVRELASEVRGDVSKDILTLADMPEISIDLPMTKHGYQVSASEVFWVQHGILRSTDLRDAMDEQCVADIAASVIGGEIIPRSKEALDIIYEEGSPESERVETALTSYGGARFSAELKYVIEQIETICSTSATRIKLRQLLFTGRTTNAFPAVFAVIAIAMHELLIADDKKIADFQAVQRALSGLADRIDTSRKSTSAEQRRKNVDSVKGLISPHLVPAAGRSIYDNLNAPDIDGVIRRSEIEGPHFEMKQGILRLDGTNQQDPDVLDKIIATICAIANNGPGHSGGVILVGVADSEADKDRIEAIYGMSGTQVGRRWVVGVRREADALGESVEDYFTRIRSAIQSSNLSNPLKGQALSGMNFNAYFGKGVIVINVPPQSAVSTVGESVFVREGDTTVEAKDTAAVLAVAQRFSQ